MNVINKNNVSSRHSEISPQFLYNKHSSQKGRKSLLKKTPSHLQSQFAPEMTLLKSQQNVQSRLKSNFLFTLEYMLQKVFKMTGVKVTIGRLLLIGI